ncbi:hypothetical protein LTS10_008129 [Elasticomyces elasticus]|nr:hypothetical protein LTS10_008129 [Elasticomyces elasticus]
MPRADGSPLGDDAVSQLRAKIDKVLLEQMFYEHAELPDLPAVRRYTQSSSISSDAEALVVFTSSSWDVRRIEVLHSVHSLLMHCRQSTVEAASSSSSSASPTASSSERFPVAAGAGLFRVAAELQDRGSAQYPRQITAATYSRLKLVIGRLRDAGLSGLYAHAGMKQVTSLSDALRPWAKDSMPVVESAIVFDATLAMYDPVMAVLLK